MSITRLACSPGVLLAVAVLAALATFGIPLAHSGHAVTASATAQPGSPLMTAATGCPSPPPGPRPPKDGSAAPVTASPVPAGPSHGSPPSGPGAKPGASPLPCAWSLLAKAK